MKPLHGIRIADFTVHNAGPFATHLLSQLGAEIIKIESAMRPDAFRKPHPVYGREGPATFDQVSATKLSVRINLKKAEGVALAKRIVANSPFSHRANKRLLEATDGGLLDAGLNWEVEHSEGVGPDMHARIAAFTNRRK